MSAPTGAGIPTPTRPRSSSASHHFVTPPSRRPAPWPSVCGQSVVAVVTEDFQMKRSFALGATLTVAGLAATGVAVGQIVGGVPTAQPAAGHPASLLASGYSMT